MPVLTHLVSLQQAAGVETHFSEFVRARASHPTRVCARLAQHSRPDASVHRRSRCRRARSYDRREATSRVAPAGSSSGVADAGIAAARSRGRHGRADDLESHGEGAVRARRDRRATLHPLGARCRVGCRGATGAARVFTARRLAIANSTAAARVLEVWWDYTGDMRVCRNALRPRRCRVAPVRQAFPHGPIKLGAAARLYPVKGLALVLHAVEVLRAQRRARRRAADRGRGTRAAALARVG